MKSKNENKTTPIELVHFATYKDGGSKAYRDKEGNEYWRNFEFQNTRALVYAKLYKGSINSKSPVLAKGAFILKWKDKEELLVQ